MWWMWRDQAKCFNILFVFSRFGEMSKRHTTYRRAFFIPSNRMTTTVHAAAAVIWNWNSESGANRISLSTIGD